MPSVPITELKRFVYDAKDMSFASKSAKTTLPDRSSLRSYIAHSSMGTLVYNDSYFGNLVDCGHEKVYLDGTAIWGCQYYGGLIRAYEASSTFNSAAASLARLGEEEASRTVVAFLREALRARPLDFPVRGPGVYTCEKAAFGSSEIVGCWCYTNRWQSMPFFKNKDAFCAFQGFERITLDGVEVYAHAYIGGLTRDKHDLNSLDV